MCKQSQAPDSSTRTTTGKKRNICPNPLRAKQEKNNPNNHHYPRSKMGSSSHGLLTLKKKKQVAQKRTRNFIREIKEHHKNPQQESRHAHTLLIGAGDGGARGIPLRRTVALSPPRSAARNARHAHLRSCARPDAAKKQSLIRCAQAGGVGEVDLES